MNQSKFILTLFLCTLVCTSCNSTTRKESVKKSASQSVSQKSNGHALYMPELTKSLGSGSALDAFNKALQEYEFVVVDFFAEWCGPCRRLGPVLDTLASNYPHIAFIKVDIDTYDVIAGKYGVRSIPTMIFFKNGTAISRETGYHSTKELEEILRKTF